MWLKCGVNKDEALVAIEDVVRGKTLLKCPYCGGELTAKKGKIKEHHFAHTEETCRAVGSRSLQDIPTLPLYDKFNQELTLKELEQLKKFWNGGNVTRAVLKKLASQGLLEKNPYKGRAGGYELTKLGKIPVGSLSLMLFNEVQEPILLEKLVSLQRAAFDAYDADSPSLEERLTDLRLYRTQIRRILSNTLYFLEIQADSETLYKIGVTQRSIEERVTEVRKRLRSHYGSVTIKVLGTWEHRGNVELYFKHRYKEFNYPIGSLTEYYKFDDVKPVLRDLRRMKPKALTLLEIDILSGKHDQVFVGIQAEQRAAARRGAIRLGMQRAQQWGVHIGRPPGEETDEAFLQKPSSQRIIQALDEGLSLRKAAQKADVAVNTVRKVKVLLELKGQAD